MRTPRKTLKNTAGFQMLSKEAQRKLMKYEHTVIWLMVLVAIISMVWSVAIHILSGDFNNGIIGAKVAFHKRDFQHMDDRSKDIFYKDLGRLINETYTVAPPTDQDEESSTTTTTSTTTTKNNISSNMLIMPENDASSRATKKPKSRKIAHLFQTNLHADDQNQDDDDDEPEEEATTIAPKKRLNVEVDRKFLARTSVDIEGPLWSRNTAVQFIYSFPLFTEIVAIIWTAMCLVFQSGVKKYWGLPKPWRIVVPSILVFGLMTICTLIYLLLANHYLKSFCTEIREELSDPTVITCGQAIAVLRPIMREHSFKHDVYLMLFRFSYILSLLLWTLALLVMVLRYIFAVDFQLIDIPIGHETPKLPTKPIVQEVAPAPIAPSNQPLKLLQVNERDRHRSEDDYQSAKSHLSEATTPLLEQSPAKVV